VETDDDVSVRSADRSALLEQDKHSIQDGIKPFGDRSHDLWNTLAIWIGALEEKEIPKTARFLMVTNKELPACIATQIHAATSEEDVQKCVITLEAAGNKPPTAIAKLVTRVLRNESRESLRHVISHCELSDTSSASAGTQLRAETIAQMPLPRWAQSAAESIADELLGWLHKIALTAWQDKRPAWVERDQFIEQFHAVIDGRRRELSRERAEHLIPIRDDQIGKKRTSRFVQQLHLVTEDGDLVDTAIREFIRCNIEKTRLSVEGNVTDDDWKAFEATLVARWTKIRARVLRTRRGAKQEDIGFDILTETTEDHREKLAGSDTEQVYLTSGTYHRLSDMLTLGWHPDFARLLGSRK
jgi:hypothetical protein